MKVIEYPDGQINIEVFDCSTEHTNIKMRINTYKDLFKLKSLVEVCNYRYRGYTGRLFIPCLFGQRSDRRFTKNQSFGLKITIS